MDLVSTYESDESDGEKSKHQEKSGSVREIDVIEITDSDSDTWSPVKSNAESVKKIAKSVENEEKHLNPSKNSNTKHEKQIECIAIDEGSDCDVPGKNKIPSTSADSNVVLESDTTQSKTIDYLNLEGSDSENEQQQLMHEEVDNLLNSAAILCDIPCGPEKSVPRNDVLISDSFLPANKSVTETHNSPSPSIKNFDSTLQTENKTFRDNLHNPDKIISPEIIANKRFKRESETPKSTISGADVGENEEFTTPTSFMYRKDERITGAFAKSVVCRLPRQITRNYISHANIITSLQWCIPQYSHLLLSASVDCSIKVFDMCCRHPVQNIKVNLGLKAAKWSLSGEQIIAGGYGKKACVFDVLSGKEIISYDIFHYVSSIEIHPYMDDVFLCGTRNAIFGYDLRVNSTLPVRTFLSKCEEVLDLAFLDENEFVCSTSIVSHDSADRTIMVWDFSSGAIMSNQIYLERYTCPTLKVHPHDSCFIAQTNGDYIAAFSTQKPYKIKDKRYMGHKVSGFGVECDISPDGKYIATGDANGDIYFYNYSNTNVINKLTARSNIATNRLKWHPALNSTLASATWDGHIQIWK